MQKTVTEMLNELRNTHTKIENELRDAYVTFQNHGVAEAAALPKRSASWQLNWKILTKHTLNAWRHKNVRSTFSKN